MTQRSRIINRSIVLISLIFCTGIFLPLLGSPLQKTIISGVVTNFEDPFDLPSMDLFNYKPFIREWETQTLFIEQSGTFRFEIEQLYPTDIMIRFKNGFSIYTQPGDSLYLTINADMLSDTSENQSLIYDYIHVNSPNQRFHDDYLKFRQSLRSKLKIRDENSSLMEAQKGLDYSEYTNYIKQRTLRYSAFMKDFIESNKHCQEFHEWAENWLYITELNDLLRYAWLYPLYNELDRKAFRLPNRYYSFLEDNKHNDEKLMNSQEYSGFLHELYMHLYREFQQSDLFSEFDSLYNAGNKIEAYRLNLKYIIDRTEGFEQEFFVSRFFSNLIYWKFPEVYDALYDPLLIDRDDYNQVLIEEYAELQQLFDQPVFAQDLSLHQPNFTKGDFVFTSLPRRFPGKVIYIDFWAPWCGPCMAEMPHSKELQEQMKEEDIVFVFLASNCTEKAWEATISQKQLTGEHFLLDDKEYALLADRFNIAGIPRYMILNKDGQVVNDNAARPSDEKLVGVLETLSEK